MALVRLVALSAFSRALGRSIVHGDPDHPDIAGRMPEVEEEHAHVLIDSGVARLAEKGEEKKAQAKSDGKSDAAGEEGRDEGDAQGASTRGTGGRQSAQRVREARTNTTTNVDTGRRRRAPARGKAPTAGQAGGAPTGGNDTNASTNHGSTAVDGEGTTSATNGGANSDPDPDAAPTE